MSTSSSKTYHIARDSSLGAMQLTGKESNMRAFVDDLLYAIAEEEGFKVIIFSVKTSNLLPGINAGLFDAVFTGLAPNVLVEEKFLFSNPYYLLGPVLVVREHSKVNSLEQLGEKNIIGIRSGSSSVYNVERLPAIVIVNYESPTQALEDLVNNKIDGVILDTWSAHVYTQGIYAGVLKIVTHPLTNEGLRLVAKQSESSKVLIDKFNKGLEKLKEKGTYQELLKKWGLYNTD